ncbi:GntR family transcriptional regulator [Paenarthrobacter sp. NPDC057981]|uniref:GntR family transcriptional regulator n=1 Tax=Paenarthrobacter sp. NPDC057981 TaxID=3346297 RepID=UPI0036D7ACC0
MLKSEHIYREIKRRILSGTYSEGYRLVLSEVAGKFGTSNLPVRDAIARLEADGLVKIRKHSGAVVAGVSILLFREQIETLAYIEGIAASKSLKNMSLAQLAEAQEINEELRRTLNNFDPILFAELNEKFHAALCAACPNTHLLKILDSERDAAQIVLESTYSHLPGSHLPGPPQSTIQQHSEILDLAMSGADEAELEVAVRQHRLLILGNLEALTRAGVARFSNEVV